MAGEVNNFFGGGWRGTWNFFTKVTKKKSLFLGLIAFWFSGGRGLFFRIGPHFPRYFSKKGKLWGRERVIFFFFYRGGRDDLVKWIC